MKVMRIKTGLNHFDDIKLIQMQLMMLNRLVAWDDICVAYSRLCAVNQEEKWVEPPLYGYGCTDEQSAWDYTIKGILEQMEEVT
jgi:hypothetical protein